jgi:SPP1 gp7 family putative phage head morphogenesis protein
MRSLQLQPIKEHPDDYVRLERIIQDIFKTTLYEPLVEELRVPKKKVIKNAEGDDPLADAIRSGRIIFRYGLFSGQFEAATSRALKKLGATWDKSKKGWRIPAADLPSPLRAEISASESKYMQMLGRIDARLQRVLPKEISDQIKMHKAFEVTAYKVDERVKQSLNGLAVPPKLTPDRAKRIAAEYTRDMDRYIKDWMQKEIVELRKQVQAHAFKGYRQEDLVKMIRRSYGVSQRKAKFLARQETSLLVTKFKEIRYTDAGVKIYKWRCVAGTEKHPVRPMHKALDGKTFSWDNPPITSPKGDRNNPGQDFNCRCSAIPIVKF